MHCYGPYSSIGTRTSAHLSRAIPYNVICFYHSVSELICITDYDFLNFALSENWFCTLSRGQINGSWFDHQGLWVLLMVPKSAVQWWDKIYGTKFANNSITGVNDYFHIQSSICDQVKSVDYPPILLKIVTWLEHRFNTKMSLLWGPCMVFCPSQMNENLMVSNS